MRYAFMQVKFILSGLALRLFGTEAKRTIIVHIGVRHVILANREISVTGKENSNTIYRSLCGGAFCLR